MIFPVTCGQNYKTRTLLWREITLLEVSMQRRMTQLLARWFHASFMKERRKIKVNREKRERRWVKFIHRKDTNAPGLSELATNLPPSVVQRKNQMHRTGVEKTKLMERTGIGAPRGWHRWSGRSLTQPGVHSILGWIYIALIYKFWIRDLPFLLGDTWLSFIEQLVYAKEYARHWGHKDI